MKYILILTLLLTGCSGGSSGSKSTPDKNTPIENILVIGDSLACTTYEGSELTMRGWPVIMDEQTSYKVTRYCKFGLAATDLTQVDIELIVYNHDPDYVLISLGAGDAWNNVPNPKFKQHYKSLIDAIDRPYSCILPPYTESHIQADIAIKRGIIDDMCDSIDSAPSDAVDGLHYTITSARLQIELIKQSPIFQGIQFDY